MKKLRILSMLSVALLGMNFVSAQNDKTISFNALPAKSQSFIREYFSESNVASVWEDTDYLVKKEYTVVLNDGTEIEFLSTGDWEEVKSRTNEVPSKIIPNGIYQHVTKNFPNTFVKEIKKKKYGYEVELSNGLDLEFNKSGKFLRIDE